MAYTPDGKWKNPWVSLTKEEFTRDTGRNDYIDSLEQGEAYDPYKDSGEKMTGYRVKDSDPFSANSFMSGIAEIHNTNFINNDPLASAVSQYVAQDSATGAHVLSEDLYGKLDYGPECKSFVEMGVGLVGSVMDQFTGIQEACAYNPSGYSANGFGNTNGLFAGWKTSGSEERRDCFGNIIKTEGLQDYVEECSGKRFNLDACGNRTEVNWNGDPLPANNDVNGFYATAGWNSDSGGWNAGTMQGFYGNSSTPEVDFWGNVKSDNPKDINMYGTTYFADNRGMQDFYGGSPTPEVDFWGNVKSDNPKHLNIFGTTYVADNRSMQDLYGGSPTPTVDFWGNVKSDNQQVAYGGGADTSWWGGNNTQSTADQQRRDDNYWNNNSQTS
jgi:hypothetical protein